MSRQTIPGPHAVGSPVLQPQSPAGAPGLHPSADFGSTGAASSVLNRSAEQRAAALEVANARRSYRSQSKRDLEAGRVSFAEVIADPEWASADVFDVLVALPRLGRVKAGRMLGHARISATKKCGGLTDRQRLELTELVDGFYRPSRPKLVPVGGLGMDVLGTLILAGPLELGALRDRVKVDRWETPPTRVGRCLRSLEARGLVEVCGDVWQITNEGRRVRSERLAHVQ